MWKCNQVNDTSLYNKHGTINGKRQLFDKMLKGGKWLECFPNDARFLSRKRKESTLNDLIRKMDKTGSSSRSSGSGRPHSAWTHENIQVIEKLICRQGHQEPAKVGAKLLEVLEYHISSVQHIVKKDCILRHFIGAKCHLEKINQDLIHKAIDQWLSRISLMIRTKGGHTEHCLNIVLLLVANIVIKQLSELFYINVIITSFCIVCLFVSIFLIKLLSNRINW